MTPDPFDDRVKCIDCYHQYPRFKAAARCENYQRAGLPGALVPLGFTETPQRCPGFMPLPVKKPAPAPEPKTDRPDRAQDRVHPNLNASKD